MNRITRGSIGTSALCLILWSTGCLLDNKGTGDVYDGGHSDAGTAGWNLTNPPPPAANSTTGHGGTDGAPAPDLDRTSPTEDGGLVPLTPDGQDDEDKDKGDDDPPRTPNRPDVFWAHSQSALISAQDAVNLNQNGHDFTSTVHRFNQCDIPLVSYGGARREIHHLTDQLTTNNSLAYDLVIGEASEMWVWLAVACPPKEQIFLASLGGPAHYWLQAWTTDVDNLWWVRFDRFTVEPNSVETLLLAGHQKGSEVMFLFATPDGDEEPPQLVDCVIDND